jgi:hypothetical protein
VIRAAVARGYGASVSKACENLMFPDCGRCRAPENERLRKFWGCDELSERPSWWSTCTLCSGTRADCPRCEGTNREGHHRCPSAVIEEASVGLKIHLDLLMRAYSALDRRNIMPVAGAWLDQSRSFLAAVEVIDAEKGYWDETLHDHRTKKLEQQQRQNKPKGRGR